MRLELGLLDWERIVSILVDGVAVDGSGVDKKFVFDLTTVPVPSGTDIESTTLLLPAIGNRGEL